MDNSFEDEFNFEKHEEVCKELKAKCPFCSKILLKIDYESHLNICKVASFSCKKSRNVIPLKFKSNHDYYFCKQISELRSEITYLNQFILKY